MSKTAQTASGTLTRAPEGQRSDGGEIDHSWLERLARSGLPGPGRIINTYLVCCSVMMIASLGLAWVGREASAFRHPHIAVNAICFLLLIAVSGRSGSWLQARVDRRALLGFMAAATIWLVGQQLSQFWAFYTNGLDFSLFDWMLFNTNHGRFMHAPIYEVNHLGVHQNWLLLPLAPLHRLFESPYVLLIGGALVAAAAMIPLHRLALHISESEVISALLVVAYATCSWTAELVEGGFRPEFFYPLAGFTLMLGWVKRRWSIWLPALLLFLSIREDASFYVAGFGGAVFLLERGRRLHGLGMLCAAASLLAVNLLVARPAFLGSEPAYLQYWSHYGSSTKEVAQTMLLSPLRVGWDVLRSRWITLFGPALMLPFLSGRAMLAMTPALVLFGTSSQLSNYRGYTIAAVLPFFFWGVLIAGRRLLEARRLPVVARTWVLTAVLLFPLFGAYVHIERPTVDAMLAWPEVAEQLRATSGTVCVQLSLFPHLRYGLRAEPLSEECLKRPDTLTVMNARFDPFPYDEAMLRRFIAEALAGGRGVELGAGFVVQRVTPPRSGGSPTRPGRTTSPLLPAAPSRR